MTDREQNAPDPIVPFADHRSPNVVNSDERREQARRHEMHVLSYDVLSGIERERLQFVRWLIACGRLES